MEYDDHITVMRVLTPNWTLRVVVLSSLARSAAPNQAAQLVWWCNCADCIDRHSSRWRKGSLLTQCCATALPVTSAYLRRECHASMTTRCETWLLYTITGTIPVQICCIIGDNCACHEDANATVWHCIRTGVPDLRPWS